MLLVPVHRWITVLKNCVNIYHGPKNPLYLTHKNSHTQTHSFNLRRSYGTMVVFLHLI